MQLGLDLSQHQLTWDELLGRARLAEQAGFDGGWVFDHFRPLYGDPRGPCLEGWTLLAALATQTRRLRLGVLVTGVTYRHPSLLAAEAATIDHLSAGRLDLGIGAAWHAEEHRQLGFPFPPPAERVARLEEAIVFVRTLLTQDRTSYAGRFYQLQDATYRPRPVQQPHPPIWVGGSGERRMLPLIARQADAWHGSGSVQELARKSLLVDEHARQAGRDPGAIRRATDLSLSEPWDAVRRRVDGLRRAGFSYLTVSWPAEGQVRLEEFIDRVMPEIQTS